MDPAPRSPNGFLSSLAAEDFELIRQHLRTADLVQEHMLVEFGDTLKRAYLPHKGVISLVVKLARGENVQVALVGRDSIFGSFSAIGDATALNSAVVLCRASPRRSISIAFGPRPIKVRRCGPC